jgi:hypothetical protein
METAGKAATYISGKEWATICSEKKFKIIDL